MHLNPAALLPAHNSAERLSSQCGSAARANAALVTRRCGRREVSKLIRQLTPVTDLVLSGVRRIVVFLTFFWSKYDVDLSAVRGGRQILKLFNGKFARLREFFDGHPLTWLELTCFNGCVTSAESLQSEVRDLTLA